MNAPDRLVASLPLLLALVAVLWSVWIFWNVGNDIVARNSRG